MEIAASGKILRRMRREIEELGGFHRDVRTEGKGVKKADVVREVA